jgi:parallel beta-helix repeat protein
MNKTVLSLGIIFLLVLLSFNSITGNQLTTQIINSFDKGIILYVGGNGSGNYTTIQSAIDEANDGDTVFVYNGTYYENVVVNKSINLIGEDKDTTIIDGNNSWWAVYVLSDSVNISMFTVRNGDMIGILIIYSNYTTITRNNIVSNNYMGLVIFNSNGFEISSNKFSENPFVGLYLIDSCNSFIRGNNISNNSGYGLILEDSFRNTITKNIINSNQECGLFLGASNDNIVIDNDISNNGKGVDLYLSMFNKISNCNFTMNEFPISLYDSNNNTITDNNITHNHYSINLRGANNNIVVGNSISNNVFSGPILTNSNYNIIKMNNIMNNDFGIKIHSSENNIILHNNLINNRVNAFDEGNNTWDDGKYGNFWSDYKERYPKAKRLWLKGIWDTPYEIEDGNNKDNCPLIRQWPNSVSIDMTRNKVNYNSLVLRFLERFPLLQQLLKVWRSFIV